MTNGAQQTSAQGRARPRLGLGRKEDQNQEKMSFPKIQQAMPRIEGLRSMLKELMDLPESQLSARPREYGSLLETMCEFKHEVLGKKIPAMERVSESMSLSHQG